MLSNERSMYKGLILYPDDKTHVNAIEILKKNFIYKGILHDKDVDDNGEIKKPHYHFVIKLDSSQSNEYLAKTLFIKSNYIQKIISLKGALNYLTHNNSPEKYQYSKDELFGDLDFMSSDEKDNSRFSQFIYLLTDKKAHTIKEATELAIKFDYLDVLKKNSYLITQWLKFSH